MGDAAAFFPACAAHELEGIVSKLGTSRYRSGRARLGSRLSALLRVSLPCLASTGTAKPAPQRALFAKSERGQLVYAGPAFIALRAEARQEFESKLVKLKQDRPIFSWLRNRDARWVKPVITLKVKHLAFGSGLLHATVRGLS